jgi:hypothetical protein
MKTLTIVKRKLKPRKGDNRWVSDEMRDQGRAAIRGSVSAGVFVFKVKLFLS